MIIEKQGVKVAIGSHENKKIVIGSDHRGYNLKEQLKDFLKQFSQNIIDVGTNSTERADYPIYSEKIGNEISKDPLNTVGVAICGSGIGIAIPASKFKGVYAARCLNQTDAISTRKHNNTNLISISADQTDLEQAKIILKAWFITKFYESENDSPYLNRFLQTVQIESKI